MEVSRDGSSRGLAPISLPGLLPLPVKAPTLEKLAVAGGKCCGVDTLTLVTGDTTGSLLDELESEWSSLLSWLVEELTMMDCEGVLM